MKQICHEHCQAGEGGGWFWLALLVGVAGGVLWLVGELLTALGLVVLAVVGVVVAASVGVLLVLAIRGSLRNRPAEAVNVTESGWPPQTVTEPVPEALPVVEPRPEHAGSTRPQLRLIRGGRWAA